MSGFSICGSIGRSTGFLMDYFMGSKNVSLSLLIDPHESLYSGNLAFGLMPHFY